MKSTIPVEQLHTTQLGAMRIKRNLGLDVEDVVAWCKRIVVDETSEIKRRGKNYYVTYQNLVLTINAHSFTIITAHPKKS